MDWKSDDESNPAEWLDVNVETPDIPPAVVLTSDIKSIENKEKEAMSIMFIDANIYKGKLSDGKKEGMRITELGYLVISAEAPKQKITTNHLYLKKYVGEKYHITHQAVAIIKPRDFESKNEMAEYGANIEDIIREITNIIYNTKCGYCVISKKEVYDAIREEAKDLGIVIILLEVIEKTILSESMNRLYKAFGEELNMEYGHPADILFRGVFKNRPVMNPQEISEYLDRMAAAFLQLIQTNKIICM